MTKKDREIIKQKFGGKCAYSGTKLEDDWQIDHVKPLIRNQFTNIALFNNHNFDNLFPVQKIINNYKGSLDLETFRNWYLGELHYRIKKLPKKPRTEKSIKKKQYLLKVAKYFGITENKQFNGIFYFENPEN